MSRWAEAIFFTQCPGISRESLARIGNPTGAEASVRIVGYASRWF